MIIKNKFLAFILAVIIIIPAVLSFSCAQDKNTQTSNTTNNTDAAAADSTQAQAETTTADPRQANLDLYAYPNVDYGQHEFKVMIRGKADEWDSQDIFAEEDSADPVQSAVYKRNLEIEEKFNIKITGLWVLQGNQLSSLKKSVMAGDNLYDAVMLNLADASNATKQGLLENLSDMSGINLSKPWWDQSIMKETSILNKVYFATGDISIAEKEGTWSMMFNKQIAKDFGLPDIYDLVKSGKWTIDKFMELGKGVTKDLNGDGVIGYQDQVAFATTIDSVQGLFYSTGLRIVKKDANDLPVFSLQGDAVMTNLGKIYEIFRGADNFTMLAADYPNTAYGNTNYVAQGAFEENRALFYGEVMQCVKRIRQMDTEFGIIPLPKADESQTVYSTYVHTWPSSTVEVPKGSSDLDRTSTIIEALAYGAYKYMTPAFYDLALKTKYARDDESSEMLDIIFAGRSADLGYVDGYGGFIGSLQSNVQTRKSDFASLIDKLSPKIQNDIDKAITKYQALS